MDILANIIVGLIIVIDIIAVIYTLYLLFDKFVLRKKVKLQNIAVTWIVVFAITFIGSSIMPKSNNSAVNSTVTKRHVAKKTPTISEKEKKESAKQEKQKRLFANINKEIVKELKEDQKFANNGNDKYNYSLYVVSIKYGIDNEDAAEVQLIDDFETLDTDQKNEVGTRIRGLIGASSAIVNDSAKGNDTYLSFYSGKTPVGHSKLNSETEFKWYK